MSVDFSDTGLEKHESTVSNDHKNMDGIQIVDPNNRYKQPKSKLHESDMGPLALALGNDVSI